MKLQPIVPTIHEYAQFADFAQAFALTERDLIFTSERTWKQFIQCISQAQCTILNHMKSTESCT